MPFKGNTDKKLRHNDNKTDLFHFLADKIALMAVANMVVVTKGPDVLSISEINLDSLDKCFHEEADTRIFVHARHATDEGSKTIMIKTNDTDIVIAQIIFPSLQDLGLQQLWVTFGHGQSLRWIGVQSVQPYWTRKDKRHTVLSRLHGL